MDNKITDHERKTIVRLMDLAFEEFKREGKVSTVRCHKCEGLIELKNLGSLGTAWSMNCPCGRFKDTLKGL